MAKEKSNKERHALSCSDKKMDEIMDHYYKNGGDMYQAVCEIFPNRTRSSKYSLAYQVKKMRADEIAKYRENQETELYSEAILSQEQRKKFLSNLIQKSKGITNNDKMKAIQILNDMDGMNKDNINIAIQNNLSVDDKQSLAKQEILELINNKQE